MTRKQDKTTKTPNKTNHRNGICKTTHKSNQKNYLNTFKIAKYISYILTVYTIILIMLNSIPSVNAFPIQSNDCYNKIDKKWQYRFILENGKIFDKLSFPCRIFGKFCDSNNPNLDLMEKKAIEVYNSNGKEGDYMSIIYEYFKDFFYGHFCDKERSFNEISLTLRDIRLCPQALRDAHPSWAEKCNPQKKTTTTSIALKGCLKIQDPKHRANCINGPWGRIGKN